MMMKVARAAMAKMIRTMIVMMGGKRIIFIIMNIMTLAAMMLLVMLMLMLMLMMMAISFSA